MPVLLDGAMATELSARGFDLRAPLFSARALLDAPELVAEIHWDYLRAGAQVLTTNSFGLHASTLAVAGLGERQRELALRSVELVELARRRALEGDRSLARFRVAGSIPPRPLNDQDCAEPDLARAEYRSLAAQLVGAGVDLILLETFTRVSEAKLALEGLAEIAVPVWLAVVAGMPQQRVSRPDGTRLIGGDSFDELAELTRASGEHRVPDALLINCTQIDAIPAALDSLIASVGPGRPLGSSPHLGKRRYDGVWVDRIVEPEVFAEQIHAWMHSRPALDLAGACCGSTPAYIAAMKRWLQPDELARERAFVRLAELVP
ncbi:Homocysteine S-methyltransferase [Enhygromyxa salina]|uniref:Homocysteine S-methyltransferase n=1 Tax=Enhygromyxa salina TaxID=215803 RepID=A0A2S9XVN5_9BACT|nr:homocysteine S-methyltransferase family protein [Enhygromyxa salina]PRP96771.1 Homocysteine S-methyltransferase [Enhygromyxa salina]